MSTSQQEHSWQQNGFGRGASLILGFLANPWVAVVFILIGVAIGLLDEELGMRLKWLGDFFVTLLSMSSLPIILTVVVTSIARTLKSGSTARFISRTLVVFIVGALLVSALTAFLFAAAAMFWTIGPDTLAFLGQVLAKTKIPLDALVPGGSESLEKIVPQNVFDALSSGQLLPLLLVSTLVGTAIGLLPEHHGNTLLHFCDDIYHAFISILNWSLYLLPFGICGLMASAVAQMGASVIGALSFVIGLNYAVMLVLCLLYLVSIARVAGTSTLRCIKELREPIFISFVTMDPFPAIPSAMTRMAQAFRLPRVIAEFSIPMTIAINGHNLVVQLGLSALFTAWVYNIPVTPGMFLAIILLAAFPGSLAGPSLPTLLAMVPYVFGPLCLPTEPGMVVILLTGPILAPICGTHTLLSSCANAALIANIPQKQQGETPQEGAPILQKVEHV